MYFTQPLLFMNQFIDTTQMEMFQSPIRKRIIIKNTLYGHVGRQEDKEPNWVNENTNLAVIPIVELQDIRPKSIFNYLGKDSKSSMKLHNTIYELKEDENWEIPREKYV